MQTANNILETPISYLKGVGPKKAEVLGKELNIYTFGDLLFHFPFRYVDKTKLCSVADITPDTPYIQLKGRITSIDTIEDGRAKRIVALLRDHQGAFIELIWFKGLNYLQRYLQVGQEYLVYGKPNFFKQKVSIPHPDMETIEENETDLSVFNRFEAVYSTTEKLKLQFLDSRGIGRLVKALFEKLSPKDIREIIPQSVLDEHRLIDRWHAFCSMHDPDSDIQITMAQYRLKFEEFFLIQMRLLRNKTQRHHKINGYKFETVGEYFNRFYHNFLPFELTNAQKRVIKELRRDTFNGIQMNRLVQGDVGSGKTIVALMAMLLAIDNGFQTCMMAPTEILAQQHFNKISELVEQLGLRVELLTGSVKGKRRQQLLQSLELGIVNILVGTHALIEDNIAFKNLGLAIIDEQHRFGVAQRAKLWQKNEHPPHVLVMTATPIPRTLAMTLYGDLDTSVIDELPPGRKPIKTIHAREAKRLEVFGFLKSEIAKGRQVYIVYPLINESETLSYKNLMEGYDAIERAFPPPDYQISVVHGQMKGGDKDFEMTRFKNKETQIMVATTVIEVGVDVPNASVMLIESAERFGLSQLHQLRGRVGRGAEQSYCILMTGDKQTNDSKVRIETMVETNDGFRIAEVDMELRGPGDLQGTQQSGLEKMRIASLAKDQQVLQLARNAAAQILHDDPFLQNPDNEALCHFLDDEQQRKQSEWGRIS